MERERSQYYARSIGNALLVAAAVIFALGAIAIGIFLEDVTPLFSGGDPFNNDVRFVDYLRVGLNYALMLLMTTAILASAGLYFRWLAVEQDARMVEFDMLLDALGVPVEDEAGDQPEAATPDA